jgi:hypothetical protein
MSAAGPPQGAKAPLGGSAVREATSVGAKFFAYGACAPSGLAKPVPRAPGMEPCCAREGAVSPVVATACRRATPLR